MRERKFKINSSCQPRGAPSLPSRPLSGLQEAEPAGGSLGFELHHPHVVPMLGFHD